MKNKTLLIDSSFLLKRSYFGAKNVYTDKFGHIGALYSFMTKLRKLIVDHRVSKVILVWDGENGGWFRHKIYPPYKANRKDKKWGQKILLNEYELKREKEKDQSILKQRKRVQAYAEELFLRQIEVENIEADDLIAAYCIDNHEKEDIVIYTNDRDFAQLLDLNIQIDFDNEKDIVDKEGFFLMFPYHYSNALTIKIICGDVSDNIKGVDGIQEKTLLKYFPELEKRYVSVNEICKLASRINKERVKNKKKPLKALSNILESIDQLKINHRIINLKEPFLSEEAEEELEQLMLPLSDEDRNSKNLLRMMKEDGFLSIYSGNYVEYIKPFYPIIQNEKRTLKRYMELLKK